MKKFIFLAAILVHLSNFCELNAQINSHEDEIYNSYKQVLYIDNIEQKLIPDIFNNIYYSHLDRTDLRIDHQDIDTIHQVRSVYVHSKKAEDGYLFINKNIMHKIKELSLSNTKISYVYNGKTIITPNDIDKVLTLKVKRIKTFSILYNKESNIIFIRVCYK